MSSTAVQLSAPNATMPNAEQWDLMKRQAVELIKSRLLPSTLATPEAVVAVILKGKELGIPPMYALSNIVLIKGKPTCSAELMLALVKRDHGPDAIHLAESTRESCTLQYRSGTFEGRFTWDMDDAKLAGLWDQQGPWKQYPKAMLRARAISALVRAEFPDSIGGMYLPEELGAPVQMTDDGAIEIIPPVAVDGRGGFPPGWCEGCDAQVRDVKWGDGSRWEAARLFMESNAAFGKTYCGRCYLEAKRATLAKPTDTEPTLDDIPF